MGTKQSKYRHILVLQARRGRVDGSLSDTAEETSIVVREQPLILDDGGLSFEARRSMRGEVKTEIDVRSIQRQIPGKSASFRLRCRNLSYKRKWNLVWC